MGSNVVKARFSRAPYLLGCLSFYSGQDKLKNRWEWSQLRSIILPLHTWAWVGTIPHHRGGKVYFETPSNFGRPHFENRPSTFLKTRLKYFQILSALFFIEFLKSFHIYFGEIWVPNWPLIYIANNDDPESFLSWTQSFLAARKSDSIWTKVYSK